MTTSSSTPLSDNLPETLPLWRRLAIGVCLIVAVVCAIRLATPSANASAKPGTPHQLTQPIESIRLGQRVVSHNPLRHETQAASAIEPATWRAVRLHSFQQGVDYDLAFLRPLSWIEEQRATVGGSTHLVMPEIGLDGPAEVLAIDPCPPIDPDEGTGRMVVTGTMAHPAANVLDISIAGETKPLGTTDTHPIWSEDRQEFVHAGELQVGERLQRADGTLTQITRITPHTGPPVMTYNLEVDGEHVYRVGDGSLLVHNQGCMTPDQVALKDLVHEATNGGRIPLSAPQAEIVLDWAGEYGYPGARAKPGDVGFPSNWSGRPGFPNEPHIHIPGVGSGHIPVRPGVGPRPFPLP